jgi:xRRM domain
MSTPTHAFMLVDYFTRNPMTQTSGLDDHGSNDVKTGKSIVLDVVTGVRESLYWDKVPENVRRQAVMKQLGLDTRNGSNDNQGDIERPKKRRRK